MVGGEAPGHPVGHECLAVEATHVGVVDQELLRHLLGCGGHGETQVVADVVVGEVCGLLLVVRRGGCGLCGGCGFCCGDGCVTAVGALDVEISDDGDDEAYRKAGTGGLRLLFGHEDGSIGGTGALVHVGDAAEEVLHVGTHVVPVIIRCAVSLDGQCSFFLVEQYLDEDVVVFG